MQRSALECSKCESKVIKSIQLDKEIQQKLEVFWTKVEDRLVQMNQESESAKQVTQAKIQAGGSEGPARGHE